MSDAIRKKSSEKSTGELTAKPDPGVTLAGDDAEEGAESEADQADDACVAAS